MRRMASSEVPGFSTQCIRKSYSLKCGRNSSPRNENVPSATAIDTAMMPSARRGAPMSDGNTRRYHPFNRVTTGASRS